MPAYDFPFNERIRSLLRIEDLLQKILSHIQSDSEHDHFFALQSLLQLVDVVDRADIKPDILQELNKQKSFMLILKEKNIVDANQINALVTDIDEIITALQSDSNKLGQHLRTNEWLMNIKQRFALPGGISKCDAPSFNHWLKIEPAKRRTHLIAWLKPLFPMQQAVYIILHILRGSGKTIAENAPAGMFHQLLGKTKPAQMLRVELPDDCLFYPEVSANKYAINVQFQQLDQSHKPQKSPADIAFKLTLCNL